MFTKLLTIGVTGLFSIMGYNISSPTPPDYISTPLEATTVAPEATPPVVETQAITPPPTFERGFTNLQNQPCDAPGLDYSSQIVSREEMIYELTTVGFTGERIEQMLGISLAEGGRQISCSADESLANSKWGVSYGVYSIRTLKAETGSGSCRDIQRLTNNLHEQTICAYEISGQGKTLNAWSTWTNGRWKRYIGQ